MKDQSNHTTTPSTSAASTTTPCPLLQPVANMEQALVNALLAVVATGDPAAIERILKLIIKKEMLLEFLLEECPTNNCPNC